MASAINGLFSKRGEASKNSTGAGAATCPQQPEPQPQPESPSVRAVRVNQPVAYLAAFTPNSPCNLSTPCSNRNKTSTSGGQTSIPSPSSSPAVTSSVRHPSSSSSYILPAQPDEDHRRTMTASDLLRLLHHRRDNREHNALQSVAFRHSRRHIRCRQRRQRRGGQPGPVLGVLALLAAMLCMSLVSGQPAAHRLGTEQQQQLGGGGADADQLAMLTTSSADGSGGGGGGVGQPRVQCPSFADNSACPCYKFEDGLFLECPGTTTISLRSTLQLISSPIQSLSIYDFDRAVVSLPADIFTGGVQVRHLQFTHSHLQTLKEASLKTLRPTLESLSIVNGKLAQIPHAALAEMQKLHSLDVEANEISNLPDYTFYGLRLAKLNIKSNRLESISPSAFAGLAETMAEIDLSDNRIRAFPLAALARLEHLRTLRLGSNEIASVAAGAVGLNLTGSKTRPFAALVFLDLSNNHFEEISAETFRWFPMLKTLSLYLNRVESVHPRAFIFMRELQSLDMSYNRIVHLEPATFAGNAKLQTVDLNHNHVHSIAGLFANLPELREVFLSMNNILAVPANAFGNSTRIEVIHLNKNAVQRIEPDALQTLAHLETLALSVNFLEQIPRTLLAHCGRLTSLSLDGNRLATLEPGTFAGQSRLREFRLNDNRLRGIQRGVFAGLPALLELHLQNNEIAAIEPNALATLAAMQHINLQNNRLLEVDVIFAHNGSGLLSLQLDGNRIKTIHAQALVGLRSVELAWLCNNRLSKLDKYIFRDLLHVEKLYLCNNNITTIQPNTFQPMRALSFLDLSGNKLRVVKKEFFVHLQVLEELSLAANEISDIQAASFANMSKLRTLDLSNNLLVQVSSNIFGADIPLVSLNLRNCMLSKLEPKAFGNLQLLNDVNLERNQLQLRDIRQLEVPGLRTLRVSENDFSDPADNVFDRFPSLQTLSMERCGLHTLPETVFARNINLVKLDLAHNQLRTINRNCFNGLNVFKELRLDHNLLTEFPPIALYNTSTLESLSLSDNALSSVDFFKLVGLQYLRSLRLAGNAIGSLSGFNAVNLTQLDYVDLSRNALLALPGNFLQNALTLQRLDLSHNRFRQIPSLALSDASLPRLGWLNFTANPLDRVYGTSNEHYGMLREIHISHTNLTLLTSKDFEAFTALQHLYLVQNRINRISPGAFVQLRHLLTLDVSVNELELLPRERLQGLHSLQLLNVSHNNLRELETFTADVAKLQVLDISFNQLHRLGGAYFKPLAQLKELLLMGNRIVTVASDALRPLRALTLLDLRRNYFEAMPLGALKVVETHIKRLRIEDNPLHCGCDSQELWQWLRDHPKWTRPEETAGSGSGSGAAQLRCEQPAELRGRHFADLEPQQFCDMPLILKVAIQDIQPYSVLVSWQARDHTGLSGYRVLSQALDDGAQLVADEQIRSDQLDHSAHQHRLIRLQPHTRYLICVQALSTWMPPDAPGANDTTTSTTRSRQPATTESWSSRPLSVPNSGSAAAGTFYSSPSAIYEPRNSSRVPIATTADGSGAGGSSLLPATLFDSTTTRCTEVVTLDTLPHVGLSLDEHGLMPAHGFIHSILTRRLGLIVGCFMGIIVFFVLITVLGWLKLKKRRLENAKRFHMPQPPPEYTTYRHFSIPHDEQSAVLREGMCNHLPSPAYISGAALGTTTTATTTSSISC